MAQPRSSSLTPTSPWLFNAPIDLLVGAGAWTIPLLALTACAARTGLDVAFAFTALTLVCNHPHYMATIHRAYADRAALMQHRRYTIYLTLPLAVALVLVHVIPGMRPFLFSAYVFWSPWHYTGQNFGLASLFARRNGVSLTANDRLLLLTGFIASYGVWLLSVQSQPSDDPYVLSLAIDPIAAGAAALALATVMLSCFLAFALRCTRRGSLRAVAPTAVLCLTQMLWFVAPWAARMLGAATQPSIYYATGALAFMHCAQYLWVTAYVERTTAQSTRDGWNPARYAATLVLGGIALFIPGPWIASALAGVDLRESLIIFTAIVNLHHFMLDGALWKLRDHRVAAMLLDHVQARRMRAASRPFMHPALQWSLGLALLVIAFIDLSQRMLTRETATDANIALAHTLNANDTRVNVRRAALLARTAHNDAAIALLQPIVATNPLHAPAQRLLGSLLLADGRWQEAGDHYVALARDGSLDAAGYVNLGVLRARVGDARAAESAFRHAVALDANLADAYLNLAEALWQQDRKRESIAPYERYMLLANPADPEAQQVYLLATLKLAEAQARAGERKKAGALLEKTIRAAELIKATDVADFARGQRARLN